jgi:hypothetical protein
MKSVVDSLPFGHFFPIINHVSLVAAIYRPASLLSAGQNNLMKEVVAYTPDESNRLTSTTNSAYSNY